MRRGTNGPPRVGGRPDQPLMPVPSASGHPGGSSGAPPALPPALPAALPTAPGNRTGPPVGRTGASADRPGSRTDQPGHSPGLSGRLGGTGGRGGRGGTGGSPTLPRRPRQRGSESPQAGQGRNGPDAPVGTVALAVALAERTADLQRLKAEYDNYRTRVHRDRLAVREIAVANVLRRLLPVLDAVAEAGRHGELTGGFLRVARELEGELAALGLATFGAAGEPFDPRVHRAVAYVQSDRAERPVCTEVVRPGHRVGDQLLRPAEVVVTGPPAAR
ncbi:nucleotide exchange factor GrpE [Streptomyces sp. TRM49041]|uniref:nucleotide exchange factor GrpE n=1 Tax=Streptomyces sp. TRM49041 TaxID=2603216 RepID=UPI00292A3F30|nr:nucleotide exchange factor GrpE [Streptomyces sp. TRM49041]